MIKHFMDPLETNSENYSDEDNDFSNNQSNHKNNRLFFSDNIESHIKSNKQKKGKA